MLRLGGRLSNFTQLEFYLGKILQCLVKANIDGKNPVLPTEKFPFLVLVRDKICYNTLSFILSSYLWPLTGG